MKKTIKWIVIVILVLLVVVGAFLFFNLDRIVKPHDRNRRQ